MFLNWNPLLRRLRQRFENRRFFKIATHHFKQPLFLVSKTEIKNRVQKVLRVFQAISMMRSSYSFLLIVYICHTANYIFIPNISAASNQKTPNAFKLHCSGA